MKRYNTLFDLCIYLALAICFTFWISVAHENEALHVKVKALEEDVSMAENTLDAESVRRSECEAVLTYVSLESLRLTDALIKGKKK
jgi:hypothetical protein